MKFSRLLFFMTAMLTLTGTNLLAQFKLDSVVFHLDSLASNCRIPPGVSCFSPDPSNVHFIARNIEKYHDSIVFSGYGNAIFNNSLGDAHLSITLDTLTNNILSLVYHEENGYLSQDDYSMKFYNTQLIPSKGNFALAQAIDSPKTYVIFDDEQLCFDNPFAIGGPCKSEIDFSLPMNNVTFYGLVKSGVKDQPSQKAVIIQPNPASNILTVKKLQKGDIEIYDLLGRKRIIQITHGFTEMQLDISSLPEGTYFIHAGNDMEKFIIAR